MIAKKYWWSATDYSAVQHAWQSHPFNAEYIRSACGYLLWHGMLNSKRKRKCKNCLRAVNKKALESGETRA